jgi:Flp pilus assembly pilin Flp
MRPGSQMRADPRRESGQTNPEYALVLAGIAVILIVSLLFAGGKVNHVFRASAPQTGGAMRPPAATCDPSYKGACIPPPPPYLSCADLRSLHVGPVNVVGSDPQGLDPDHDGIACD